MRCMALHASGTIAATMKVDVLIIGGGLAGASLACALRGSRLRVALVERTAPVLAEGWDARIYAVSPANADFLERCGAWQHLDAARRQAIERIEVRGDAGGKLAFSAYEAGLDCLAWILESSRMAVELWQTASRQPNISVICPAQPVSLTSDGEAARLQLADGRSIEAALVVGADGVNSWVREQSGLSAELRPYGESGVVANFECERPHFGTAYQWFRSDGVLAWLPLPGNRISMVWSTPHAHADALLALSAEDLCAQVAQAGESTLGGLSLLSPAAAFPLRWMKVAQPVKARVALIGDAAHAIHPLSGHGINLGFQDARVLADELLALPAGRDPGDVRVLQRYVRKRAEEVMLVQGVTDGLSRLFAAQAAPVAWLRNTGMSLTGHMPLAKSALVRYAAGLL